MFQAALVTNFDVATLKGQLNEVVHEVGQEMLARIVRRTAVDTGQAKRGWEIAFGGGEIEDFTIRNDVDYVVYLENGTYKMAAQPMIRPTLEEAQSIVDDAVNRVK